MPYCLLLSCGQFAQQAPCLETKEQEMKQRWVPNILLIQDEISLVPAAVRSMRARQDEGLHPGSYFHAGELMGRIPILLIAGGRGFPADQACQRDFIS